ncbi:MAG: hypothetical protein ISS70_02045 [Phycisphaerae bacterium]|nr:hypothetical protein [Phycisphaerae bacterium]
MCAEQKPPKMAGEFFSDEFFEGLPKSFPKKTERIKDELDELRKCFDKICPTPLSPPIRDTLHDLEACKKGLEDIRTEHKFSTEVPQIYKLPLEFERDNDIDVLAYIGQKGIDAIRDCFKRLKTCVENMEKEAEKKERG